MTERITYHKKRLKEILEACRTRSQRIRTMSEVSMQVKILCHQTIPVYQLLASKIKGLKALGMSNNDIALRLSIHAKTVVNGLSYQI